MKRNLSVFIYFLILTVRFTAWGQVEIHLPLESQETLNENSPINLEKSENSWQKKLGNMSQKSYEFVAHEFTPSAAAFYLGSLFQVARKMMTHPENDAEMLKNFMTNQIFSAQAQASFMLFLVGAKTTNSSIGYIAKRFHWIKDEEAVRKIMLSIASKKRLSENVTLNLFNTKKMSSQMISEWKTIRNSAETLVPGKFNVAQFSKFQMFSGFGAGFFLSTLFSDIINDPDISYFASALTATPEEISNMIVKYGYTPTEAHQRAYERWVIRGKIKDYTPHLLSAWTTIAIQSFVLPKVGTLALQTARQAVAKSSHSVKQFFIKSLQLVFKGISYIPQGRLLSAAVHAYTFLEINDPILHYFENVYEGLVYGDKLNILYSDLLAMNLRPQIPEKCLEQFRKKKEFNQKTFDQTGYSSIKKFTELSNNIQCEDLKPSYAEILKEFHLSLNHWREFWFKTPVTSLNSWSQFFASFNEQYQATYEFYKYFITEANNSKSLSFDSYPYYGLAANSLDSNERSQTLAHIYLLLQKNINSLNEKEKLNGAESAILDLYKRMFYYFMVFNERGKIPSTLSYELDKITKLDLSSPEKENLIELAREKFAAKAIDLFNRAKLVNPEIRDSNNDSIADLGNLKKYLQGVEFLKEGEFLMKQASLVKKLNPETHTELNSTRMYGLHYRNISELQLIHLSCGPRYSFNGESLETNPLTSAVIQKIPFWSTFYTPPRLIEVGDFNPCSLAKGISYYNTNPGYYKGQRFENLAQLAQKYIKEEFKGPKALENLDIFWKNTIEQQIKKSLSEESEKFSKIMKDQVFPALFAQSKHGIIPKGIYQSYQLEIQSYFSILKKIMNQESKYVEEIEKWFYLFMFITSNPTQTQNWLEKISELKSQELKSSVDVMNSSFKNPYQKAYMVLDLIRNKIIEELNFKLNSTTLYSPDQTDAIHTAIENSNMALNGLMNTLSYYKIFSYTEIWPVN